VTKGSKEQARELSCEGSLPPLPPCQLAGREGREGRSAIIL